MTTLSLTENWQINRCEDKLRVFWAIDVYKDYDEKVSQDVISITEGDLKAANKMRARAKHSWWTPQAKRQAISWLRKIDKDWDLIEMSDEDWQRFDCENLLENLIKIIDEPRLGPANVTKVLHLKRPRFIPVCDSIVLEELASRNLIGKVKSDKDKVFQAIKVIREIGKKNREALQVIKRNLESDKRSIKYENPRIIELLIWMERPNNYRRLWEVLGWA